MATQRLARTDPRAARRIALDGVHVRGGDGEDAPLVCREAPMERKQGQRDAKRDSETGAGGAAAEHIQMTGMATRVFWFSDGGY